MWHGAWQKWRISISVIMASAGHQWRSLNGAWQQRSANISMWMAWHAGHGSLLRNLPAARMRSKWRSSSPVHHGVAALAMKAIAHVIAQPRKPRRYRSKSISAARK